MSTKLLFNTYLFLLHIMCTILNLVIQLEPKQYVLNNINLNNNKMIFKWKDNMNELLEVGVPQGSCLRPYPIKLPVIWPMYIVRADIRVNICRVDTWRILKAWKMTPWDDNCHHLHEYHYNVFTFKDNV